MGVFERIVVATDYSDCSHAAVQQAYYLARAAGAELHAVHVIDAPGENRLIDAYESAIDGEAFQAALLSTSRQLMRESLEELGIRAAEIEPVHLTGNRKADVLIEYAQAVSSNLIVVGTHGRRGLRRFLLGSVAQSIVAASQLPVLIAREHAGGRSGKPVRRIMVPVDLSERSLRGLEAAQTLASLYHAQLEIIHVLERYVFPVSLSEVKTVRDLVPDIEARTRKMIRAQVENLGGPFIPHSIHVREGEPATTIVELADELACDLLVVTRRGLSASARYVVGSVTEKILQAASCSVFVEPAGAPHE
jgi:nucleotide-binding universal stress UspA family protein